MKLSTKVLILVSVPVLFTWIQLSTMSYILSMYEKALVSAGILLDRIGVANLDKLKLYLVCSGIFTQLLAMSLGLFFFRMLTRRIGRACDDLKKIQAGEELEPAPNVSDEFAKLDAEVRRTAAVVRG